MRRATEAVLLAPIAAVLVAFVAVPSLFVLGYSFFEWVYIEPLDQITLQNYSRVLTNPATWRVMLTTALIAFPVCIVSIFSGYILSYYIVFGRGPGRRLLFILVVTAMMASYLVRMYSWRILLGTNGVLNGALMNLGYIDKPLEFILFSPTAVILAEVSFLVPLAALALFAALSGVSPALIEAARDLGASRFTTFMRVTLPLTGQAVFGTTVLILFLAAGDYLTPIYVGGPGSVTVGRLIAEYFSSEADYGLGATYSVLLIVALALAAIIIRQIMLAAKLLPRRIS